MRAMVFNVGQPRLEEVNLPVPSCGEDQILIRVCTCGVCRTDLHIVDGELTQPKQPLIPGHQIVGRVVEVGHQVEQFKAGDRVGVPWMSWTCGECRFCRSGRENLCEKARFTGYTVDGGYAEYAVANEHFCFPLTGDLTDTEMAPLLCAGLIGYRALKKTGEARRVGLYGFGAAAHIVTQVARYQGREIFAFTRPGDHSAQEFARKMGAVWAGDSLTSPPEPLDAAIIFASAGSLVPAALKAVDKGGAVVCGGIHMSDIPSFPYEILWDERTISSVANLTRQDGDEFLALAARISIRTTVRSFALGHANDALNQLRAGQLDGSAVLEVLTE
jgi:propanol-preferring alcohol dehydrogenase